jgi:hypothetical protein
MGRKNNMPLKNFSSSSALPNIFAAINKTLVSHGARQIVYDYEQGTGRIVGIIFIVETVSGPLTIKLPAMFDRVKVIFDKQGVRYKPEQPYRTTWATLRDWVDAQMALIDWQMAKMEQVFLPYAVTREGKTFFEVIENKKFLLDSGAEDGEVIS